MQTNLHSQHAQAIVRYLQKRGAWITRIRAGWGMRKGLPDILACWQGKLLAIEVKTATGEAHRRTAGQVALSNATPSADASKCLLLSNFVNFHSSNTRLQASWKMCESVTKCAKM